MKWVRAWPCVTALVALTVLSLITPVALPLLAVFVAVMVILERRYR